MIMHTCRKPIKRNYKIIKLTHLPLIFLCRKKLIVWTLVRRFTEWSRRTSRWWDSLESWLIILKCWRADMTLSCRLSGAAQRHQQRLEVAGWGVWPRLLRPHRGNRAGGDQSLLPSHLQAVQSEHRHGNNPPVPCDSLCSQSLSQLFAIRGLFFFLLFSSKWWNWSACFIVFLTHPPHQGC